MNALQGGTALRVKGMKIIDCNYQNALNCLLRHYDNGFIRLATHIEALIMLPSVKNRNFTDLSLILDRCEESVQGLCDLDQFDDALCRALYSAQARYADKGDISQTPFEVAH